MTVDKENTILRSKLEALGAYYDGMEEERDRYKAALESIHAGNALQGKENWTLADVIQAHYAICRQALSD